MDKPVEQTLSMPREPGRLAIHELIAADARELSEKLQAHRLKLFPPTARKKLRPFSSGEAAKLVGVNDGYLRQLSLEGKGPKPETNPSGRRSYTFDDIQALRTYLDETGKSTRRYRPWRITGDHLQVVAVVNFKGGLRKDDHRGPPGATPDAARLSRSRR